MLIWLYSFLVQSTLFLGAVWLLTRALPKLSLRSREIAWNTAILAALVGPTMHVLFPAALPTPWQMPQQLALTATETAPPAAATKLPANLLGSPDSLDSLLHPGNLPTLNLQQPITPAIENPDVVASPPAPPWWLVWVSRVWVIGACLSLLGFAWRYQRLRQLLEGRQPVLDGHVRLILDRLRLAAGLPRPLHLTMSGRLGSPVAIGVGRNAEICLPSRALQGMPSEQLHAMLGHEVAHHMRRDPVHLIVLNFLQSLFFFQPMLRLARADLHQIAEQQCDAWGAHQAGDRWSMARCLAEVATWLLPGDSSYLAAGMARRRSQLTTRVRSLMDENHDAGAIANQMGARKHLFVAAAALIAAPFLAPQVVSSPGIEMDSVGDTIVETPEIGDALQSPETAASEAEAPPRLDPGGKAAQFLAYWDLTIQLTQQELEQLRTELGPFIDHPSFKSKLERIETHLLKLKQMRSLLERVFILLSLEDGPSSEEAAHTPLPNRN